MPTYKFTNARGDGPRGVNRMSGAVALVAPGETRELAVNSREIPGLEAYFDVEPVSDEPNDPAEAAQPQRMWLAVAAGAEGEGFRPVAVDGPYLGMFVGTAPSNDPADYRWEPMVEPADPLDHDGNGRKGGDATHPEPDAIETGTVALMLESCAADVAAFVDGDDRPSDAVLRAYIERKTGHAPHPNAKTLKLVEKAKEAAAG